MATATTAAPPVHTVRLGRVKVCIWENKTANRARHNMTLHQGYKDGDNWKETHSVGRDFGYQAARAMQLATDWIFQQGKPAEDDRSS